MFTKKSLINLNNIDDLQRKMCTGEIQSTLGKQMHNFNMFTIFLKMSFRSYVGHILTDN